MGNLMTTHRISRAEQVPKTSDIVCERIILIGTKIQIARDVRSAREHHCFGDKTTLVQRRVRWKYDRMIEIEETVEDVGPSPVLEQTRSECLIAFPQGIEVVHDVLFVNIL